MAERINLHTLRPEDPAATALAVVLGFRPERDKTYVPWMKYILGHWSTVVSENDFFQLCRDTVKRFITDRATNSRVGNMREHIDSLVRDNDHYYFSDAIALSPEREQDVKSTIMLILGPCTLMRSYFVGIYGELPYVQVVVSRLEPNVTEPLSQSLAQLVTRSGLLPSSTEVAMSAEVSGSTADPEAVNTMPIQFGSHSVSLDDDSISPLDLNLFRLATLAGVQIRWTDNLSRHMLLSNQGLKKRYIELFALPCALQPGPGAVIQDIAGISANLQEEIRQSYAILFSPHQVSKLHRHANKIIGLWLWCWCLSCSSARLTRQELRRLGKGENSARDSHDQMKLVYDPELENLVRLKRQQWNRVGFQHLWPRIMALDECLQEAKPWNFWVLLRDRRDTVQYWTFLFGSIILILTILQVVLGTLQVASPFSGKKS